MHVCRAALRDVSITLGGRRKGAGLGAPCFHDFRRKEKRGWAGGGWWGGGGPCFHDFRRKEKGGWAGGWGGGAMFP